MNIIDNIRRRAGYYLLKKILAQKQRYRKVYNIESARSIGIIYEAIDQESFRMVSAYADKLRGLGKNVKVLGYVPAKKYHQDYYMKLGFDIYTWKEVNWYYKPIKPSVNDFMETPFDILIDLGMKDLFALEYIVSPSESKFKIGKFIKKNNSRYDMMIDIAEEENLEGFIKQVHHYLSMINKFEEND